MGEKGQAGLEPPDLWTTLQHQISPGAPACGSDQGGTCRVSGSFSLVIRFPADDCPGAIELLGEQESRHVVRQRPGRQGKKERGSFPPLVVEAKGAADHERRVLGAIPTPAKP